MENLVGVSYSSPADAAAASTSTAASRIAMIFFIGLFPFLFFGPVHKKTGSFLSRLPGKCMRIRCVQRHRIIWRRAKQLSNAPVTEYARETCIRQHMLPDSFFIAFLYIAIPPSEMR